MITVLSQTPLATVQDLGRTGALRWGVGTAGAMDPDGAHRRRQSPRRQRAECSRHRDPGLPRSFEARLERDAVIAVTGANGAGTLDGAPILPWFSVTARAGQIIRIAPPPGGIMPGARGYLCISGGIDVPVVLNSRSTQLRGAIGGFEGRALKAGDRLPLGNAAPASVMAGLVPWLIDLPLEVDGLPAGARHPRRRA